MEQLLESKKEIIPIGFEDNIKFRVAFHQRCEQYLDAKFAALRLFKNDVVDFIETCLFTYDPREKPSDIPFILYDYQEEYAREINDYIQKGENLLTEKSRDMGVTWIILAVFYYRWLLFDENFLIGSRKEELVDKIGDIDSLFERLRYFIRCTPQWLLDACQFNTKSQGYMKIFKENGASITGESMNDKFSRQGRYNAILLDEFAFVERAEIVWRACGDSAPCKLPVSTPNGALNTFARLRKSGQIKVKTLLWKLHPHKTDDWYKQQVANRPARDIAQELDINYTVSAGKPFYGGFIRGLHTRKIELIPNKELLLGWDYGYHSPVCLITQVDSKGRWNIMDCLVGKDELIDAFGERAKIFLNRQFNGLSSVSYGDPAGEQESDKSKKTSVQILADVGFKVKSIPSNTNNANYDARKLIIEKKLKTLIDGIPALTINDIPSTQIVIEALEGGWHYPGANRDGFIDEKPVKEGYYEHPMNALEYIAVNIFKAIEGKDFIRTKHPKGKV
jgi:hypothetical protein